MAYETLIFDLDGTISDPKEGMLNSLNYSLEHHGFKSIKSNDLDIHIGPPLEKTMSLLTNQSDKLLITSLIDKYRERYSDIGFSENKLYQGMRDTILRLHNEGTCQLAVCTSKRIDLAQKILKMHDLFNVFIFVNGGDIGIEKWQQLRGLLEDQSINTNAVMIGDRSFDLSAAHRNNLHSAGVLWGYGPRLELEGENPRYLFDIPEKLFALSA